jgi:alanyl-tRNA synthetase
VKDLYKEEFNKHFEQFYPTRTLQKEGFQRSQCTSCYKHFWSQVKRETCGDTACEGGYQFIGQFDSEDRFFNHSDSQKVEFDLKMAWDGFRESFSNGLVPCTPISRYPIAARWRDDTDFVSAGIYCFQPHVVNGEAAPPANPLICPQFCVRFNDLDNIGVTGRHYSGFVMLGIQAFNPTGEKPVMFQQRCTQMNYNWLVNSLQIPSQKITFVEDVWAGGGCMGPSMEYFVDGLEVGNMVFMQYSVDPKTGARKELPLKVVDVGIGLERVAWLKSGLPSSYLISFQKGIKKMASICRFDLFRDIVKPLCKFSKTISLVNVEETDDVLQEWQKIAKAHVTFKAII